MIGSLLPHVPVCLCGTVSDTGECDASCPHGHPRGECSEANCLHERDPFKLAQEWLDVDGVPRSIRPVVERMIAWVETVRGLAADRDAESLRHFEGLKNIEDALDKMGVSAFEQYEWPARLVHRVTSMGGTS